MKHTFRGPYHRVHLKVLDIKYYNKWRKVTFVVQILPLSAHPSTAFSTGKTLYGGPHISDAMEQVRKFVPNVHIPVQFCDYVKMETRGEIYDGSDEHEWKSYGEKLREEHLAKERGQMSDMYPHLRG